MEKHLTSLAFVCALITQTSYGNLKFTVSGGLIESIEITSEITFTSTGTKGNDSVLLVLNNAYQNDTFLVGTNPFTPNEHARMELEDGSISDISTPFLLSEKNQENLAFNFDARDLLVGFSFFENTSINVGDSIIIRTGVTFTPNELQIAAPDNLSDTIIAHLIAADGDVLLTDEVQLSIVPELSSAFGIGLFAFFIINLSRRRFEPVGAGQPDNPPVKLLRHLRYTPSENH